MKHTLTILMNKPFTELTHIFGLFSERGFNIDSLNTTESSIPEQSRLMLVISGEVNITQLIEELNKEDSVVSVCELPAHDQIEREMALMHVNAKSGTDRLEVIELANIFGARVIDASNGTITLEATAERDRIDEFLQMLQPLGISDIVRGAALAIEKRATARDVAD